MVITDLDASLLWHDYSFDEAKPTIRKLKELGFPLIFNSSKTVAEMKALAEELNSVSPIIAENGGVVAIHKDDELKNTGNEAAGDYSLAYSGMSRDEVLSVAHQLREEFEYKFRGFDDFSSSELCSITKLTDKGAILAKDRHVTEPILWFDTEERFQSFNGQLAAKQIRVVRGGKFIHLMGEVDKSKGAQLVIDLMKKAFPSDDWTVVAIGDSENDLGMLELADLPIVIPHDGEIRIRPENSATVYATQNASAGWAEEVEKILAKFENCN
ncbi:HAD-IIB family hydrolase [Akkermansiaceae bacterium]|nr:HAD-IIB family hydrolase [Akkermansiaceae bacterium]